jgi:GT2 family glycosyltransferase
MTAAKESQEPRADRRVSVVIPHLNQPEALARCLNSLTGQDWPAELIDITVVDNGSRILPDLTALGHSNVRLLTELTPGPGHARNRGIADSAGDVVALIDADCRAHPHWVSAAVAAIRAPGSSGVVGGDVRIDVLNPSRLTSLEAYESVFAYRQQLYIRRDGYSGTGNLAMLRSVFDKVGPFGGIHIAEDVDWGRRAKAAGYPARFCADMIVYHPARTSIDELKQKWRRHIAHGRVLHREMQAREWRWALRALLILLSAIPDGAAMLFSPRVRGLSNRLRGIGVLFRIRLFRFVQMIRQRGASPTDGSERWNRDLSS